MKGFVGFKPFVVRNSTKHCYWMGPQSVNADAARSHCEGLGAGAHLVTVTSPGELRFIERNLTYAFPAFTDGTDEGTEGNFRYPSTGEPFPTDLRMAKEPNNAGGGQHCVAIQNVPGADNDGLDDKGCGVNHPFVCEREPVEIDSE